MTNILHSNPSTSTSTSSTENDSLVPFEIQFQSSDLSSASTDLVTKAKAESSIDSDVSETADDRSIRRRRRTRHQLDATWIPVAQFAAVGIIIALSLMILLGGRFYGAPLTLRRPLARLSEKIVSVSDQLATAKKIAGAAIPSSEANDSGMCSRTCRVQLVESIPQNLTFDSPPAAMRTSEAWRWLIESATKTLTIAAYKSSLRGRHVFGGAEQHFSDEGEQIFDALLAAGLRRRIDIRILENSPSKDKGDNEDARLLEEAGAVTRRQLNLQQLYGTGVMHSKFLIADGRHFYLGSANLDWRSLNQKMEMGVLVRDCACMARDLNTLFELYWRLAVARDVAEASAIIKHQPRSKFDGARPLHANIDSHKAEVFLAASPRSMNAPGRVWDLNAIVQAVDAARSYLTIHVMDYFPLFIYSKEKRFWPTIDDAIRAAVLRGVHVRILTAAIHYPKISMRFLESLETLNALPRVGSIQVKVMKIPSPAYLQSVIRRDRRIHKKFLVSDDRAVIGTSNWSGDYFEGGTTGAAIVIRQNTSLTGVSLLNELRASFERDWTSVYAHSLREYVAHCLVDAKTTVATAQYGINQTIVAQLPDFCEPEKDRRLFVHPPVFDKNF